MSRRHLRVGMRAALALTTLFVLAACASAPTHYLTLFPPSSTDHEEGAAAGPSISVSIPAQVDQPELVARHPDGTMAPVETERWIAPLGEEIRGALQVSLASRWPPSAPAQIRLDVLRFDSVPGSHANLEAAWTITLDSAPKRSASCRSSIREDVGAGYPALAAGHRAALQRLAAELLQAAGSLQSGAVVCNRS